MSARTSPVSRYVGKRVADHGGLAVDHDDADERQGDGEHHPRHEGPPHEQEE